MNETTETLYCDLLYSLKTAGVSDGNIAYKLGSNGNQQEQAASSLGNASLQLSFLQGLNSLTGAHTKL
jgi:hypothetical protein